MKTVADIHPMDETQTGEPLAPTQSKSVEIITSPDDEAEEKNVKRWSNRIRDAKKRADVHFQRMRKNMEFVFGIQRVGQQSLDEDEYVVNLTNKAVNLKVSTLYAHDPKAIYRRRKRLEYAVWDEKMESLGAAVQRATATELHGLPPDGESNAIVADYEQGKQLKEMIDRVGKTLEIIYQYNIDSQEPDFKMQMKQLVRRVVICGAGFVGLAYERTYETTLDSTTAHSSVIDRVRRMQALADKFDSGDKDKTSADAEQLRMLASSVVGSAQKPGADKEGMVERLVFDFIPATSLIVDPACRCLKGFVGAHWITQEMILPVDYVNAFFELNGETEISTSSSGAKSYSASGEETNIETGKDEGEHKKRVALWHVFDLDTKSQFWLVDGHKRYVQKPDAVEPQVRGFFPVAALTFNDCEVVEGTKASVYPPSDVDLMKHAQKEWNRTREGLREHRKAKAPKWLTPKGVLTEDDLTKIQTGEPCEVIQMESITKADDILKILIPFPHEPIDPAAYDTKPLADDMMFAVGTQEANLGPAKPNVTATVGSIAEHSRMSLSASNVDDLDDFLSSLARMGGEMILREMSIQTAKEVAGNGAVLPQTDESRRYFLNSIFLEIVAASSGRPNKAMELQNAQTLGPLLMQAGANPMFLVRELIKRLDDRLDPEEAFPLVPQSAPPGAQGKPRQAPAPGPAGPPNPS